MSNKPTHIAYIAPPAKEGSPKKLRWHEVGVVWPHKNGQGFDVVIHEGMSIYGKIICVERKESDKTE